MEDRFAELRGEIEERWAEAQAKVDQKISETQELLRAAVNDLSVKIDELQAKVEAHMQPEPETPEPQ